MRVLTIVTLFTAAASAGSIAARQRNRGGNRNGNNNNVVEVGDTNTPTGNTNAGTGTVNTGTGNTNTGAGAGGGGGGGGGNGGGVNTAVIPTDFGITAGQGRGTVGGDSCVGANQKPIPCNCPPAPNDPNFLGQLSTALNQGFFPTPDIVVPISLAQFNDASDTSEQTNRNRATAMIQVMQSLTGERGVGCPGVSFPVLISQQQTGQVGGGGGDIGNAGR